MLTMLALAAAISAPPADPDTQTHAAPVCGPTAPEMVTNQDAPSRAQKLNALPNANLVLGVVRMENGCQQPVIVRYDIGGAPRGR